MKSSFGKASISSVNLGQDVESADKLVNCRGIRAFKVFVDKEEDIGGEEKMKRSQPRRQENCISRNTTGFCQLPCKKF